MCRLQWQHQNHHSQCNLNNPNFEDCEFYDRLLNHQRFHNITTNKTGTTSYNNHNFPFLAIVTIFFTISDVEYPSLNKSTSTSSTDSLPTISSFL